MGMSSLLLLPWLVEGAVWFFFGVVALTLGARSKKALFLALAATSCFFLRIGVWVIGALVAGAWAATYLDVTSTVQSTFGVDPAVLIGGAVLTLAALARALQYALAITAVFVDRQPRPPVTTSPSPR